MSNIAKRKVWNVVLCLLISAVALPAAGPAPPDFDNPPEDLTESGYVKLSWSWAPDQDAGAIQYFEVQQALDPDFLHPVALYHGPDYATFLSGLKNGDYFFRVRAAGQTPPGRWSEPVLVRVRHHSLSFALALFSLGALVFLLTVGIVIQGHLQTRQNP